MTTIDWKHEVILLLGGNLGDVRKTFGEVYKSLNQFGSISKKSSLYKTEAWGMTDAPAFLNQVLVFNTNLAPVDLLESILTLEMNLGRVRESNENYSSRIIDIDILFFDDFIVDTPDLIIPHPKLHLRNFTLEPLIEIIPHYLHPKFDKSLTDLGKTVNDELKVIRLNE